MQCVKLSCGLALLVSLSGAAIGWQRPCHDRRCLLPHVQRRGVELQQSGELQRQLQQVQEQEFHFTLVRQPP